MRAECGRNNVELCGKNMIHVSSLFDLLHGVHNGGMIARKGASKLRVTAPKQSACKIYGDHARVSDRPRTTHRKDVAGFKSEVACYNSGNKDCRSISHRGLHPSLM
jgi:hypothetical protein